MNSPVDEPCVKLIGREVEAIHEHIRGVVTHEVGDSVVIDGRWEVSRSSVRVVEDEQEAL